MSVGAARFLTKQTAEMGRAEHALRIDFITQRQEALDMRVARTDIVDCVCVLFAKVRPRR